LAPSTQLHRGIRGWVDKANPAYELAKAQADLRALDQLRPLLICACNAWSAFQ
jgi:hypothetical protein